MIDYIKLCRPPHAIKNLLVILPPFFGHRLLEEYTLKTALLPVLSFTMIAAAVYDKNDVADVNNDRNNPSRKNRPLASGRVSIHGAIIFVILLLFWGFLMVFFACDRFSALFLLFAYFIFNVAYSLKLKNIPVLDVFILASGFVIRVYFGGFWFGIAVSPWLFLCVMCGAICFALGKRRNEMLNIPPPYLSRPVLRKYTNLYLTNCYYLFCGMTMVFFSLWTVHTAQSRTPLIFTIPLVMLIMMRYNLIIETTDASGDPVPTLLKDIPLILLLIIFATLCFVGVYCP